MSIGDGMRVQAMMNGLQFITSTSPNVTSGGPVVTETTPVSELLRVGSYNLICIAGHRPQERVKPLDHITGPDCVGHVILGVNRSRLGILFY